MLYKIPVAINRIYKNLLLMGVIILFSCQSESLVLNPPGGYNYSNSIFYLESAYSSQDENHTGFSYRLYSGILNNDKSVVSIIKFQNNDLDSSHLCLADSIFDVRQIM